MHNPARCAHHTARAALLLLPLLLIASGAFGQSKTITTEDLARKAEIVAVGKVTAMKSEWDQKRSRISTRVTVSVGEYLKGGAGSVMTVVTPGGEVDGVGEWYSHTARFKKDEDVVVFAEKDGKGNYRVAGGHEGKFSIKKDAGASSARVSEKMTLDDFKSAIRQTVSAPQLK